MDIVNVVIVSTTDGQQEQAIADQYKAYMAVRARTRTDFYPCICTPSFCLPA